ncbi:MAG: ATP-dependent helicase HrpB [Verrucomicrobia bacterium]|nr:MAG: ATP-dependent helicase HrpB [Verrucomicrobiota bacterium]
MNPKTLPIYEVESALVTQMRALPRGIVTAPTGSGKSTQVPQMLLDRGLLGAGQVVILQPRRIAARMLAARVAHERGGQPGGEVGYQIRFEDVTSKATRIRYVTEGILLRQMLSNPRLDGISAVIFDEFHERHLYGDLTLARALALQKTERPDLLILVMSATLDTALLEKYLAPCALLESAGRTFSVHVDYLDKPVDFDHEPVWEVATREWERAVHGGAEGDALIFMPGAYEIARTVQTLQTSPLARGWVVLPLHGELPPMEQDAAVADYDKRKVIVATNVAETSLTIPGVRIVIDSGLARIPRYDPHRGINTLLIEKISRASTDQRAGRAGRTAPGHCLRLWTVREHPQRPPQELPEIRRLDLAEVILTLKAAGITDIAGFQWLESPDPKSVQRSETLLRDLGALDEHTGAITPIGQRMLSFPVHPRYARMLLAAQEFGCVRAACLAAALTQGRSLLVRRTGKDTRSDREDFLGEETTSDFFILMRAWNYADRVGYDLNKCRRLGIHAQAARQVRPLFDFFQRIAREQGLTLEERAADDAALRRCLLLGFSDQLAVRLDGGTLRCQIVHGRRGQLARESSVRDAPLIVAAEVNEIEGRGGEMNVLLSTITAVEADWLRDLFPDDFHERTVAVYDHEEKRVFAERQRLFRDLPLEIKRGGQPPEAEAAALLAAEVLKGDLKLDKWDDEVEQWILRVNFLVTFRPDLALPEIGEADRKLMIEQICLGAYSQKDLRSKSVVPVVRSWLTGVQQAVVEKFAPERLELPTGHRARITYGLDGPPTVAAKIQDLYDVKGALTIAGGRVPLVIQILGPNFRPVQVTQDLPGFWRDHYPRIKQELQRKYPKHKWR